MLAFCMTKSWSVETPSWQTALAGCAWDSHLQARPHDVPLFARTSTSVPRRDIDYVLPTDTG